MLYTVISKLVAWVFPTKDDRDRFRDFCKELDKRKEVKIVRDRFPKLLAKMREKYRKQKLKVVFLSSENSKWAYQALYEELDKNPKFDVQVLVTVQNKLLGKKYSFWDYRKLAERNYNFFKSRGINVDYAFDFENKKYKDLCEFNPDIIFYEQPWELAKIQSIKTTSKYALPMHCSYGSSITNSRNEYVLAFYRELFTYFLDNKYIKKILLNFGMQEKSLKVCGHIKLDAYLKPVDNSKIQWKTTGKKRVIWAPHHSFYKSSILKLGTFDWNYKFFYNFAKNHPEIEFIFKPHPELKEHIVKNLMTIEEMNKYFKDWEELENAQVYEEGDYFDMFRTSDLMITDCNSFLYEYLPTGKPLIHLISKDSVGHNAFGEKICIGYYSAENLEDLNLQMESVLLKDEDPLAEIRRKIIKEDLIQPEGSVAKYIENYIVKILEIKDKS